MESVVPLRITCILVILQNCLYDARCKVRSAIKDVQQRIVLSTFQFSVSLVHFLQKQTNIYMLCLNLVDFKDLRLFINNNKKKES